MSERESAHLNWISPTELARLKKKALSEADINMLRRIKRQEEQKRSSEPPYSIEWD